MAIRRRGAEPKYYRKSEVPIEYDSRALIAIQVGVPVEKVNAIIQLYLENIKKYLARGNRTIQGNFEGETTNIGDLFEIKFNFNKNRGWAYNTGKVIVVPNGDNYFEVKGGVVEKMTGYAKPTRNLINFIKEKNNL